MKTSIVSPKTPSDSNSPIPARSDIAKRSGPRTLLHLEGLVALTVACLAYRGVGAHWGQFLLLFLMPDVSMVGYCFGRPIGAAVYNAAHTYVGPFLLGLIAYYGHRPSLLPLALIWVAHIGFDRLLGYGLKYATAFKDTHLGRA